MKKTATIILLFLVLQSYGQKWHLKKIDKSKKYAYGYRFQIENKNNTCSYKLIKHNGNEKSVFEIYDNKGEILSMVNLKLTRTETNIEKNYITGFEEKKEICLKKGKYILEVTAYGYDNFKIEFEIKNKQNVNFKIKLGLAPELEIYEIHSKNKLNKNELNGIINCVERKREFGKCSKKNEYQITMQI